MSRRDAETIRELVAMLRLQRERNDKLAKKCRQRKFHMRTNDGIIRSLQDKNDAAEARIAELQARPAAPSVEVVADALVAMHDGAIGPADALADVFPDFPMDRTEAIQAAYKRYFGEKDDGA